MTALLTVLARRIAAPVALAASLGVGPIVAVADVPTGEPVDGIQCQSMEGAVFHIHQHLAVFAHGKSMPVPADLGQVALSQCLYWIHSHTPDGIIHIESPKFRTFTLGNVFDIWGEPLSTTVVGSTRVKPGQVEVFLGGVRYKGDPRKIELAQHTDITIEAGPPYAKPVPFTQWGWQLIRTNLFGSLALGAMLGSSLPAGAADLTADAAHTSATFSVKHLTLTTIGGSIGVSDAKIGVGSDDVLTSADATLALATIDTKFTQRDDDLKSDHWFDVAKFPTMTFKSTKITGDKNAMTVVGDLTFHGVTKPATLAAKFEGMVKDGRGRTHLGFSATTTIDRTQWGVGTNFPPAVVGDDVTVSIELEAIQP